MKLRNWGFTLIEMLGVFTILAIIMFVAIDFSVGYNGDYEKFKKE